MKRSLFIKIHLYFSGVTLFFLSMMALSGSLHLLADNETEEVSLVKSLEVATEISQEDLTAIFEKEIKDVNSDYTYDYIKGSSTSLISRPTTRTYYSIKLTNGVAKIEKHNPSLRKSLMELHKGHGPRSSRLFIGIFGLTVLCAVLSGLWLGLSSPAFRKITVFALGSGAGVYLLLYFL